MPSICNAQLSIGPFGTLSQSYLEYQKLDSIAFKLIKSSKLYPTAGVKVELPINKFLFISVNVQFGQSRNKLYEAFSQVYKHTFIINQSRVNTQLNSVIFKQFSLGVGADYLYAKYKTLAHRVPDLRSYGLTFASSFKHNNIIFEVNYLMGLATNDARKELSNALYLKPFNVMQLNIAYLFKTKLLLSKKGLDCPRF